MAASSVRRCGACKRIARPVGPNKTCPYCGVEMGDDVPASGAGPVPSVPPPPPPPSPWGKAPAAAPPPPIPAGAPSFPERMKANKVLAGRVCPGCNQPIELGQDVFNCQSCNGTMHQGCRDTARTCLQLQCPTRQQAVATQAAAAGSLAPALQAGNKPCPYCGEQILASAKKCRFCGEYLNAADRMRQERTATAVASDENLTTTEIVFSILCSGIACILGLVWLVQGKKKGGKMMAIAIVSNIIIRGIIALLGN